MSVELLMHMNNKNLNLINKTFYNDAWPLQASFFQSLLDYEDDLHELAIVLVDKQEMSFLNEQYRHKKGPTDVLSFPNEENTAGDIILCPKEIFSYAYCHRIPYTVRFLHLIIHSMIHLKGLDHYDPQEAKKMFAQEEKLWFWSVSQLGLNWKLNPDYTYSHSNTQLRKLN